MKFEPLVTASLAKQIAEKIRESITDGGLKADDQLPTEAELARQFSTTAGTIMIITRPSSTVGGQL